MRKVWAKRNGMIEEVSPKTLTTKELCDILDDIKVDGGSWMPEEEINEGYAAIKEAIRRLKGGTRDCGCGVKKHTESGVEKYTGSGVKKHTAQKKFPASCVKCGCRLSAKTALEWDVPCPSSNHRYICAECAEEEGLTE